MVVIQFGHLNTLLLKVLNKKALTHTLLKMELAFIKQQKLLKLTLDMLMSPLTHQPNYKPLLPVDQPPFLLKQIKQSSKTMPVVLLMMPLALLKDKLITPF